MSKTKTPQDYLEDELDAIRLELYEKTKNMTPAEETAYIRGLVAPIHKEFGITPVSTTQAKTA